ncbi:phosphosulfolactate synthase [Bacillus sp. T33-2]|uniref:phosphosulfolactate synthase n=1 Tax=Bacillus sp. T33-2 TaxID=2054168 RepID=UPI000C788444|nr:phosphosulfolactate synthase [Bacillus sp. T33-2]PLR96827.1 phosphosulfolactate synthase [Bacillus sp. T33-2]
MRESGLNLPKRDLKPRISGITVLIDNGNPLQFFKDTINGASEFVDYVKFGWGTSIISSSLEEKIEFLRQKKIEYFFGGTLFEKFVSQGKVEQFYKYCEKHGCRYVEISNGTFDMNNKEKALFISEFSRHFTVFSEVGNKSTEKSEDFSPAQWIEWIHEDLDAGSAKVITEARESGTSGFCRGNGEIRFEIIEDIISSGIGLDRVIFEAPNKQIQTALITAAGANVNLANISFADPIALETLRLGLRSDTFHLFD